MWGRGISVILELGWQRQEDQQFKVILGYTSGLRQTWDTWDPISKQKKWKQTPHSKNKQTNQRTTAPEIRLLWCIYKRKKIEKRKLNFLCFHFLCIRSSLTNYAKVMSGSTGAENCKVGSIPIVLPVPRPCIYGKPHIYLSCTISPNKRIKTKHPSQYSENTIARQCILFRLQDAIAFADTQLRLHQVLLWCPVLLRMAQSPPPSFPSCCFPISEYLSWCRRCRRGVSHSLEDVISFLEFTVCLKSRYFRDHHPCCLICDLLGRKDFVRLERCSVGNGVYC